MRWSVAAPATVVGLILSCGTYTRGARANGVEPGSVQPAIEPALAPPSLVPEMTAEEEIAEEDGTVPGGVNADSALGLDSETCHATLDAWGIPYERVEGGPESIEMPIRLTGPVWGITFVIPWEVRNHHDVLDCRLALVLAEWAVQLGEADIIEVRIFSFYRQGNRRGTSGRSRLSQHHYGLAIDAGWFVLADGTVVSVLEDFELAEGGGGTCDAEPSSGRAAVLAGAFCDAWDARLFHVQLSPEHNSEHRNHFHMDIGGGGGGWYVD